VIVRAMGRLFRRVDAQDLVEYTLLLAFIALVGISVVIGASGGVQGIWGASNQTLVAANSTASGGASAPADNSGSGGGGSGDGHGGDGHGGDGDGH
jgi:Flp pilus assembly pilin Flp